MAKTAILAIKIVSDATKAARELDQISAKTSRMGKVSSAAGKAFALGIGAAAVAAVKFGNAAAEDEREAARLAQTLKKAAGATDSQVAATERWITAQGKALGVTDTELRPAISRLAVATGDLEKAQRLAALAMNVSAGSGKSLKQVSEALAKAQNGNLAGLSKLGVATKDVHGKTLSLEQITRKLAATYEGAAANAAETQAGKADRLKVRMDELQEAIGTRLTPVLLALTSAGLAVVGWMEKHQTLTLALVGAVLGLLGAVAAINVVTKVYTATTAAWASVTAAATAVQNGFKAAAIGTRIQLAALKVQTIAITVATKAWAVATKAAAVAQRVFNAAMRANPIGLIITAIGLLIAGLVLAYKKSATFRAIVDAVGRAGKAAFGWIIDKISDLVGWVKDKLPGAFNAARDVISGVINVWLTPLRIMKDLIDKILGLISKIDLPSLPDINPFGRVVVGTAGGGVPVQITVQVPGGFVGSESQLAHVLAPAFGKELERISRRGGR